MEYDAEMVRRLLGKSNDKSKRGGRTAAIVPIAVSDLAELERRMPIAVRKPEVISCYGNPNRNKPIFREIPQMKRAPRKKKGGGIGSLFSGIGKAATTAASAASRYASRVVAPITRVFTPAARAVPAARVVAPAAVKGITPNAASALARAAARARTTVAARPAAASAAAPSAAAAAAAAPSSLFSNLGAGFTGLATAAGLAYPIYGIISAQEQAKKDEASAAAFAIQDALDRAQAKLDKDAADRLAAKYERDYDTDRAAAAAEKLAAERLAAQEEAAYREALRLQKIEDDAFAKAEKKRIELEAELEKEKQARIDASAEAYLQSLINSGTGNMNPRPGIPANIPTPTHPYPIPSNPVITFPESPPPPRRGRKGGSALKMIPGKIEYVRSIDPETGLGIMTKITSPPTYERIGGPDTRMEEYRIKPVRLEPPPIVRPKAPRRRKGGAAAPVRSMKDLRMDLLRLGYIM